MIMLQFLCYYKNYSFVNIIIFSHLMFAFQLACCQYQHYQDMFYVSNLLDVHNFVAVSKSCLKHSSYLNNNKLRLKCLLLFANACIVER